MTGVGIDLDRETDAERSDRHRAELTAHVAALTARGEQATFKNMWDIHERHRLEWLEHPTADTLARREHDRLEFGIRGKRGDGPEAPEESGEAPKPRAAPRRRRQAKRTLARRR